MHKILNIFFMHVAKQKGFTLLETVIYIGLLSLLMTSAFFTAWQLLDSLQSDSKRMVTHEEGYFVLYKITALLADAQSISQPTHAHSSTAVLAFYNKDADLVTVRLNSASSSIEVRRKESLLFVPLTTSNVVVSDAEFIYLAPSATVPASVRVKVTIDGQIFETETRIR